MSNIHDIIYRIWLLSAFASNLGCNVFFESFPLKCTVFNERIGKMENQVQSGLMRLPGAIC